MDKIGELGLLDQIIFLQLLKLLGLWRSKYSPAGNFFFSIPTASKFKFLHVVSLLEFGKSLPLLCRVIFLALADNWGLWRSKHGRGDILRLHNLAFRHYVLQVHIFSVTIDDLTACLLL